MGKRPSLQQQHQQIQRLEELADFRRAVDHVKGLIAQVESNRAAKPAVVNSACSSIARELSQLRQRALTSDLAQLADVAGALSILAARQGGILSKIRSLTEGVTSLELQLEQASKAAMAPPSGARNEPPDASS